jgi:hypothetical protein
MFRAECMEYFNIVRQGIERISEKRECDDAFIHSKFYIVAIGKSRMLTDNFVKINRQHLHSFKFVLFVT